MSFLAALKFLTVIPMPGRREASPRELGRSLVYFPVVGLIIGLTLAGLNWLLGLGLPPAVVNVLLVVWLVVISGALHLDGLADTCDGIGGQKPADARLQVMRDSRVGGFGVVGVSLLLLVKYVTLNSLPEPVLMASLIFMPVISRWTMVYAVFAYPYARTAGLGSVFKQAASRYNFALATVIALAVVIAIMTFTSVFTYLAGLVIIGGAWVIIMLVAVYLRRKFAGLTGDTYGTINEIAEVAVLVLASLLVHCHWLLV